MDYYSTLGLNRGASDDDIKKAYRKLAMKHHPDRGGDEKKFKEISTAYDTLSDPEKRRIVDMGGDPNGQPGMGGFGGFRNSGPFEFHFGGPGMEDLFGQFGFGPGFGRRPMRKNMSFNISINLTLEEVLTGKDVNAEVSAANGKKKMINISIPPGVDSGQQIRYQGMGDDSTVGIPPGDLIVNINVLRHSRFSREGDNLFYEHKISVWEAMLGSELNIVTLDNRSINVSIPKGTQPETVLSCRGEGLPNARSRIRGNLLVKIKVSIPKNLSQEHLDSLAKIKNELDL